MKQTNVCFGTWEKKGKITRRERFLAEMDAVIPWERPLKLIEPRYPKAGQGRAAASDGADAADFLHAELVEPVGPANRGLPPRQRVDASLCRD